MKKQIATFLFILMQILSNAQKHDYIWIVGQDSKPTQPLWGTLFNFHENPVALKAIDANMTIDAYSTTMSDKEGNLLFYTNGDFIANKKYQKMVNGDRLNPLPLNLDEDRSSGLIDPQGVVALPWPNDTNKYALIHSTYSSVYNNPTYSNTILTPFLYTSTIQVNQQTDGEVIEKNKLLIKDTLATSHITACKHANGRDWWLLFWPYWGKSYYRYLLEPTGIRDMGKEYLQDSIDNSSFFYTKFTNDGTKYVRHNFRYFRKPTQLRVFDFDRCTGRLNNQVFIEVPTDTTMYASGMELSPNSRFAYVMYSRKIWQYDLWATDIKASETVVAEYDGFKDPFASHFFFAQQAPNGKIYINCSNGIKYWHVIDKPDEKGIACTVKQHSIVLTAPSLYAMPNFPNYRLGRLIGSPCDTIRVATHEITKEDYQIKIFPNPATTELKIDITLPQYDSQTATEIRLVSAIGAVVKTYTMPDFAYLATLDISNVESGFYEVQLRQKGRIMAVEKVVVIR